MSILFRSTRSYRYPIPGREVHDESQRSVGLANGLPGVVSMRVLTSSGVSCTSQRRCTVLVSIIQYFGLDWMVSLYRRVAGYVADSED